MHCSTILCSFLHWNGESIHCWRFVWTKDRIFCNPNGMIREMDGARCRWYCSFISAMSAVVCLFSFRREKSSSDARLTLKMSEEMWIWTIGMSLFSMKNHRMSDKMKMALCLVNRILVSLLMQQYLGLCFGSILGFVCLLVFVDVVVALMSQWFVLVNEEKIITALNLSHRFSEETLALPCTFFLLLCGWWPTRSALFSSVHCASTPRVRLDARDGKQWNFSRQWFANFVQQTLEITSPIDSERCEEKFFSFFSSDNWFASVRFGEQKSLDDWRRGVLVESKNRFPRSTKHPLNDTEREDQHCPRRISQPKMETICHVVCRHDRVPMDWTAFSVTPIHCSRPAFGQVRWMRDTISVFNGDQAKQERSSDWPSDLVSSFASQITRRSSLSLRSDVTERFQLFAIDIGLLNRSESSGSVIKEQEKRREEKMIFQIWKRVRNDCCASNDGEEKEMRIEVKSLPDVWSSSGEFLRSTNPFRRV